MVEITVEHYGFDYPPVGIIGTLKKIPHDRPTSFVIFDPLNGVELPYDHIKTLTNPYVIITTHEAASHRWFDRLIPRLINQCGIPENHIILRSDCLYNPDTPIMHVHTLVDECSDFVNLYAHLNDPINCQPTHHYVYLNRQHRWHRYRLADKLLRTGLDQFGKISYLESPGAHDARFPLQLDMAEVTWQQQRSVDHPGIRGALFNIISETGYEPEPGVSLETHYRPGISEKTYKCFVLSQIPIWLSAYRSVDCFRALGFDVFDDVVDHGYDQEPDPEKRIDLVADQIGKVCELQNLAELRQGLRTRFQHNFDLLKSYAHNHDWELPQWRQILTQHKNLPLIS